MSKTITKVKRPRALVRDVGGARYALSPTRLTETQGRNNYYVRRADLRRFFERAKRARDPEASAYVNVRVSGISSRAYLERRAIGVLVRSGFLYVGCRTFDRAATRAVARWARGGDGGR